MSKDRSQPARPRILCFCDSPTLTTGFSVVVREILRRWAAAGFEIHIWGIAFQGTGYWHHPWCRIQPAQSPASHWSSPGNMAAFLKLLRNGGFTHCFILQDTFMMAQHDFPKALAGACKEKGIRSLMYFPVDGPLQPEWTDILAAVDVPVAYTEYGRAEALRALVKRGHLNSECKSKNAKGEAVSGIFVLPHGVNQEVFRPDPRRGELRKIFWAEPWVQDSDFLMVNVNVHQTRKDVCRSLEILAELKARGVPARLLMHMKNEYDGIRLDRVAAGLGLKLREDWHHHDECFTQGSGKGSLSSAQLAGLYNIADLCLTTTLGEGWGLSITEALACGCPVALPMHTSCQEIFARFTELGMGNRFVALRTGDTAPPMPSDNSHRRPRVDVRFAADRIQDYYASGTWRERPALNSAVAQWLDWNRIAAEMLKLLLSESKSEITSKKGEDYYLEFAHGLGDIFVQCYQRGAYNVLRDLGPNDKARVAIISHNPAAKELLEWHPKRNQIEIVDCGYYPDVFTKTSDAELRKKHNLPPADPWNQVLPEKTGAVVFHPSPEDERVLSGLEFGIGSEARTQELKKPLIVLAASAGLPDRDIPADLIERIVDRMIGAGLRVVVAGRDYERHGHREWHPTLPEFLSSGLVLDLVDKLSAAGTAELVRRCAGIVTCHSALCSLGWLLRKPTLLLYPQTTWERHFKFRDRWAFGCDYPETVHARFEDYTPALVERFLEAMKPELRNS